MRRVVRWLALFGASGAALAACSGGLDSLTAAKHDASADSSGGRAGSAGHDAGYDAGAGGSAATGGSAGVGGSAGAPAGGSGGVPAGGAGGLAGAGGMLDGGGMGGSAGAGGSGGTGGAGGTGGSGVGTVPCGNNTCDVAHGEFCCRSAITGFQCQTQSCNSFVGEMDCDGPEDCGPGELCCGVPNGINQMLLTCQGSCTGTVYCGSSNICPAGQNCKADQKLPGYYSCQ